MAEFIMVKVLVEKFIKGHVSTFAFKSNDMPGICWRMMNYKLNVDPKLEIIDRGVDKLIKDGFIREVIYLARQANIVLVRKGNGKWRLCIGFMDLNKACLKD